ncbi:hypothetical protein GCE9029_02676 [Grimontia celer]|uniref:Uncharacterized protein n=1 Tax=Grimontia celer TaxID=1796497 RepID=A0A128F422_9GAMM|nr:hypothetical protein [Grimontia celer]CZF81542.1 hypothetical protein GCE9029_02676 [Grimontia celer]
MKTSNGKDPEVYEFGWWPEVIGFLLVNAMFLFLFLGSQGSL